MFPAIFVPSVARFLSGIFVGTMSLTQLVIQTAATFIAAGLGAILGAFLARRTEHLKHLQELRSAAYSDFLRGVATAAEKGGIALVADSRARIAIYAGKKPLTSPPQSSPLSTQ